MPRGYHHGDLRRVLVAATIDLIDEKGLDGVSVREVAKRAGVSPSAPFRHFPTRVALLTAVAEDAMDRLVAAIDDALADAEGDTALQRFRAVGVGFLRWAITNRTHFQVISTRDVIAFGSSSLSERHQALQMQMRALLEEAAQAGDLKGDPTLQMIAGRALAYGLARMFLDGQFPSWGLSEDDALATSLRILDEYMASISQ